MKKRLIKSGFVGQIYMFKYYLLLIKKIRKYLKEYERRGQTITATLAMTVKTIKKTMAVHKLTPMDNNVHDVVHKY